MQKHWLIKSASVVLIVMLALALMPVTPAYALSITSNGTGGGLWSSGSTWAGGTAPTATDTITIASGDTVTLDADITINSGSLTINSGATLVTNNFKMTLANDFINNGGTFTAGSSNIEISGLIAQNIAGFTTTGTVSMTKTNNSTATFTGNVSAGALTINGSTGTLNLGVGRTHTISGVWTNTTGTLDGGSSALSIGGATSMTGGTFTGSSSTLNLNSTVTKSGGTFTPGTTVNYGGAAQIVIPATYNNLTLSGSGAKTTTGAIVNGILSMEGTATVTGTLPTYGAAATLQYNTATSRNTSTEWITPFVATGGVIIANTGTITLNSTRTLNASVPLTINSGATFSSNNAILILGGNFTNAGTFNAGTSTITMSANFVNTGTVGTSNFHVTISGTATQSIAGFPTTGVTTGAVSMTKTGGVATFTGNVNAGALTINGPGGTLNLGSGLTHTFTGAWTRTAGTLEGSSSTLNLKGGLSGTGGTFTAGTGTVNYGASANQNVAGVTYNNLSTSGTSTKTSSENLIVSGTLTVGSGTTYTIAGIDITVTGATTVNGTLTHSSLNGTKTYNGNVTINSGAIWNDNTAVIPISFGGNLQNDGTWNGGTGVHTFTGVGKTISGTSTISIPNVTIDTGASYTNNGTLTISTSLSGSGSLTQGATGTLNLAASAANFTLATLDASASGNTVNYNGADQTVKTPVTYHHLTLGGTGTKTLTGLTTVNGNLTFTGTTASGTTTNALAVGGNLTLSGTGTNAVTTGAALTVGSNLNVTGTGVTTFTVGAFAITVNGATTISGSSSSTNSTLVHSAGATPIYKGLVTISPHGIWTNSGNVNVNLQGGLTNNSAKTFTAGTGLYTFDTNNQSIDGSEPISIPNVTVAAGVTLTNTNNNATTGFTIGTTLAGSGGLTQDPNAILNIGGTSTISTLTATANPNTVDYNGATAQTVKSTPYHHLKFSGSGVKTLLAGLTTVNGNLTLSGTASATTADHLTIGGALTIGTGTDFSIGAFDITVTGATTLSGTGELTHNSATGTKIFTGDVTINSGSTWYDNAEVIAISFGGSFANSGTLLAGQGVHTFTGAGKTFSGTISIPSITITGSYTNNGTLTADTALAGAGSLTQGASASAILNIGATTTTITTLTASGNLNTVRYNKSGNQTVRGITYHHLFTAVVIGTATKTLDAAATINGNLTIGSNTTLDVSGSSHPLTVKGSWTNSGSGTFTPQSGTVTLSGSAVQTMGGSSTFNNLVINNSAGVTLSANQTVNGILTLTSGKVTTGGSSLIIGTAGSVTGATGTAPARYVFGNLRKDFAAGSPAAFTFDIGDSTNYTPIILDFATISTAGNVTASTTAGEHPNISTSGIVQTKDVNRYWTMTSGGGLAFTNYDATFTFVAGDKDALVNTSIFIVKRNSSGTTWPATTTGTRTSLSTQATGVTGMSTFAIGEPDVTAPTVTNVSSDTTNGSYNAGDVIAVKVTFSELVVVTGTPRITLETGTTDRIVNYTSGSGSINLIFNYTVQAGDTSSDLDYVGTGSLTLNSGTINDPGANAAILTLASPGAAGSLGANKAIVIDTTAPTVSSVSSTTANGSYNAGDTIDITVTFNEIVNVVTTGGTPTLTLETGTTDRTASYASGTGSTTLTFTYTVQAGDTSSDLDYVDTASLALNGGTIRDVATNNATLTLVTPGAAGSLGANKALVIDTTASTVTNVTSTTDDGLYSAGSVIAVTVTFNEVVNATGTPQLTLETGGTDRTANYASGTGSTTLTFNYTVQAGDTSSDLDYVGTTSLALNSGTIKDVAGNDATLTLPTPGGAGSLGLNKAIVIDTTAPTVTNVTSTNADASYVAGNVIAVTVTFNEIVNVVTTGGTPTLTLETGTINRAATYASGSGSTTLTFNYTVVAGDASSDLDYVATNSLALNGGTIKDVAANAATLTLPAVGGSGSLGFNKAIVIDTTIPTVINVTSTNSDGSYKAGSIIAVTVTFSELVIVTGTPTIKLETGATDRTVNYTSGSGSITLTFNYTVQAGDTSGDLDYFDTASLVGTIKDADTNNATLTLPTPGAAGSLAANKAIVIDTTVPTVTNVTSTTANGSYKAGDIIAVTVIFSESVNVTGTPTLTLETGTTDRTANYASGSGSTTLTFNYTVQAGDISGDLNYVATSSLALSGGTIGDAATNAATLTLPALAGPNSLASNKAIVIDTTAPTVTNVTSTTTNGSYTLGDTIVITVTFSEAVTVTGTPTLTLETGATDRAANYVSGTGLNTLTFNYTVQAGDVSSDLDYVSTSSLALSGGTIRDAAANNATLTLPAPGAAGSLGANKAIVISTTSYIFLPLVVR